MKTWAKLLFALLILCRSGHAQGFVNLDFESATVTVDNSQGSPFCYATNAIPGWTPYIAGLPQTDVAYNGLSGGGAQVNLEGTNNTFGFPPIEGSYYVLLQGAGFGHQASAAIGQSGQVPASAQSILFCGSIGNMQVSFKGNPLTFIAISSTLNYTVYEANIAAYAGQTGQLLFTNPNYDALDFIDNIQFSPSSVPEPRGLALAGLGGLYLGIRRWRKAPQN